jgi:hypothetical protein
VACFMGDSYKIARKIFSRALGVWGLASTFPHKILPERV